MSTVEAPAAPALLARHRVRVPVRLDRVLREDRASRGAVVTRDGPWFRRPELCSRGTLVYAAAADAQGTTVEVWGHRATPGDEVDAAVEAAAGWAGLHDDLVAAGEILSACPVLRRLTDDVGEVRLSRTPQVAEAFGRSVVEQLVQSAEARRSIAQMVARIGDPVGPGMWSWPRPEVLGATPVWELRRCGISGRMIRALHAGAVEASRLERARGDWAGLDARLRALLGVGPWTSAETRLRLGDPDAVSVGDYHLPTIVGYALSGPDGDGPGGAWTDAGMLALLEPYRGQRGRVIRLAEMAAHRGSAPRKARRAPRAAYSVHRYW